MIETVAFALRLGLVLAGAAPVGAVLLLAIARLTGAEWGALVRIAAPLPLVAALAVIVLLVPPAPAPEHLGWWLWPPLVALRGSGALAALAWAGRRLAAGAGTTFAGVTLALYAWLVTPIASDWLMAGEPGHPVSAVGMMLAVQQIGAALAVALVAGWGDARRRRDWSALLVAAALGLCYLGYMDYLIVWFGNLPSRVPFYLARARWPAALVADAAILLGLAVPVALLARGSEPSRRWAGGSALAGLALFDGWWLGAGFLAALLALLALALPLGWDRRRADGRA